MRTIHALIIAAVVVTPACGQETLWKAYLDGATKAIAQKEDAEAEKLYELALKETADFPPGDIRTLQTINRLAVFYSNRWRNEIAEAHFKKGLTLAEKHNQTPPVLANQLTLLANQYRRLGKYAEAEPLYKRALAVREKSEGAQAWTVAQLLRDVADNYRDWGKNTQAELLYKRSLSILAGHKDKEYHVAFSLANLGELYRKQDRLAQAEPLCRQALAMYEKLPQPSPLNAGMCTHTLAQIAEARGKNEEALSLYESALNGLDGSRHPQLLAVVENLARLQRKRETAEADKLDARAKELKALMMQKI